MFFLEKQLIQNRDTIVPNSFFEYVLPLLSSAPYAVSVYLYGYYLAQHASEVDDEIYSNDALAEKLDIPVDEVYHAWQLCEDLGLITKHVVDPEITGGYSVEFRDLRTVGMTKKSGVSTEELLVSYQNQEYKKMYDKIEQTIQYPLSVNDIKKIHQTIRDFNISKDLVVEAVLYSTYKKKSRSISLAMGVLRNWHLDGIRTVEDLDQMMQGKEKRYMEYKKILGTLGEYRGPTEPEREMMDMWLDEYLFDVDSVIDAIGKTTSIKSPNLKYVDGILKNRRKLVEENREDPPMVIPAKKEKDEGSNFEIRTKIMELIKFPRKTLRKDEMEDLDTLSRGFEFSDIEVAYHWLRKNEKEITFASMLSLLNGELALPDRKTKITVEQVKLAEEKSKAQGKNIYNKKTFEKKDGATQEKTIGPLEKRLQQKRLEEMKNQGKLK